MINSLFHKGSQLISLSCNFFLRIPITLRILDVLLFCSMPWKGFDFTALQSEVAVLMQVLIFDHVLVVID